MTFTNPLPAVLESKETIEELAEWLEKALKGDLDEITRMTSVRVYGYQLSSAVCNLTAEMENEGAARRVGGAAFFLLKQKVESGDLRPPDENYSFFVELMNVLMHTPVSNSDALFEFLDQLRTDSDFQHDVEHPYYREPHFYVLSAMVEQLSIIRGEKQISGSSEDLNFKRWIPAMKEEIESPEYAIFGFAGLMRLSPEQAVEELPRVIQKREKSSTKSLHGIFVELRGPFEEPFPENPELRERSLAVLGEAGMHGVREGLEIHFDDYTRSMPWCREREKKLS